MKDTILKTEGLRFSYQEETIPAPVVLDGVTPPAILHVQSLAWCAIALIVGIVSGTYSSICIAGPLWVNLRRLGGKKTAAKKAKA